jgi:hypothetical protein
VCGCVCLPGQWPVCSCGKMPTRERRWSSVSLQHGSSSSVFGGAIG